MRVPPLATVAATEAICNGVAATSFWPIADWANHAGKGEKSYQELVKDESKRDVAAMETAVNTCFRSKDYIEGRDAFLEKRKPVFKGK